MKKILFALGLLCPLSMNAQQITVAEPEFAEETVMLMSDSEGKLLKRENGNIQTKAGASLYLTGIGKVKSRLTLEGPTSVNTDSKGGATTRLIIKAIDNKTDPNSFINIFKFEINNNKERRYQLAEVGTLSKAERNNLSSIDYKAKKYGESSYLIIMEDLTPGEYGIVLGDPNNQNTKNTMKVTTFTVSLRKPTGNNQQDPSLPRNGTIVKTNGIVINAVIDSVSTDHITYRKSFNENEKLYTIPRNKVNRIDYK